MTSNTNMISILCFAAMLTAFVSCTEDEKDDTQSGKKFLQVLLRAQAA